MIIKHAEYISEDRETINVFIETDDYTGWYTYSPHDDAELATDIGCWLADNSSFQIDEYTQPNDPEPSGLDKSLKRVAFFAMLDLMSEEKGVDIEAGILSFIETQMPISTPQEKASRALAKRLFTEGQEFVGTNPLFSALVPALGLAQAEFEAAWETAASFIW